jgi:hypothetical protein
MRTPAGSECSYYYEDFHRGRNTQECRIPKAPKSAAWRPEYCAKCPVPRILLANASATMELTLNIKQTFLGFGRKMEVMAHCLRHDIPIADPYVGCEQCNKERPGLDLFKSALEE